MKKIISIYLMFIFSFAASAQEVILTFEKANESFRNKEYAHAIELYESILKNGYSNTTLLYNLGNSYYKNNNIPAAILNYERAIKSDPSDEDIKYNLKLANLKTIDKIEPLPELFLTSWLNTIISSFNSDKWSVLFIVFIWFTLGSIVLFSLFKNRSFIRKACFLIMTFGFVFCIGSFLFAYKQHKSETQNNKAIVFQPTVYVKNTPDEKGTDLFIVHEGLKVHVVDEVNGWLKIKLSDGNIGWLWKNYIELI